MEQLMSSIVLPHGVRRRMMKMATANYGPKCSTKRVKVHYHPTNEDGTAGRSNWTTMSHEGYFLWLEDAPAKGLVLESVEQLDD
jgi:hypothetical protein